MDWPSLRYATIVADPPWPVAAPARYLASARAQNWLPIEQHYAVMSVPAITALPVGELALPDAHLFLWTTGRFLPAAIAMLPEWGFEFMYPLVWHKNGGPQLPGGPCFNAEYVVYGRRGRARFEETQGFFTAFYAPRSVHSAKPGAFYRLLERITPGPRIDLFARARHPGFDAWGNGVSTLAPAGGGRGRGRQLDLLTP